MGIGAGGTTITAFGWNDGDVFEMRVYWLNDKITDAEIVGAKKSGSPTMLEPWKPISAVTKGRQEDPFAVAQWDHSKHMRFYYYSYNGHYETFVLELCNDDDAGWVPGAKIGGNK